MINDKKNNKNDKNAYTLETVIPTLYDINIIFIPVFRCYIYEECRAQTISISVFI